jgi:hypothetical protein
MSLHKSSLWGCLSIISILRQFLWNLILKNIFKHNEQFGRNSLKNDPIIGNDFPFSFTTLVFNDSSQFFIVSAPAIYTIRIVNHSRAIIVKIFETCTNAWHLKLFTTLTFFIGHKFRVMKCLRMRSSSQIRPSMRSCVTNNFFFHHSSCELNTKCYEIASKKRRRRRRRKRFIKIYFYLIWNEKKSRQEVPTTPTIPRHLLINVV